MRLREPGLSETRAPWGGRRGLQLPLCSLHVARSHRAGHGRVL